MRYPAALKPGDTIGVCAPSSGVSGTLLGRLDKAVENVTALGYQMQLSPSVRQDAKCVSADARIRADEFTRMYEAPHVAAILPPWGGEFLMDVLPLLAFSHLRDLPPKWVCGYSDTTTLLFPLMLLCDVATVHGSNLMNMGYARIAPSDLMAFQAMSAPALLQSSAENWGRFTSGEGVTGDAYWRDRPGLWKTLGGESAVTFEGRMIGGCLDVLCKLIGTPFAPVDAFLSRYGKDGFIWSLESCEMKAADIYRTLWQMRTCGWFERCRGVLFGRPDGYGDNRDFTLVDALAQSFSGLDIPVVYDADIGHTPPQMQIINGAMGRVQYDNGRATVRQDHRP